MTDTLLADEAGIARAAALLRSGKLLAFGTETVYGLGADATNPRAVAAVFEAKGRPRFNPLICHYADADAAFSDVIPNDSARILARALWPAPLTLVLPRRPVSRVALLAAAGLDTLAVRVPAPEITRKLLQAAGRPIAAPSANRSGAVSPTTAQHVLDGLGDRIAAVLDSGPCLVGVESTVVDLAGDRPMLLRPGGVTVEAIEALIGPLERLPTNHHAPRSPGLLRSHYAPSVPVRLNAASVSPNESLLAFGTPLAGAGALYNLSASGDLTEAAARLFSGLRILDLQAAQQHLTCIAAMPVPESGLGLAINDRLRRAAFPREAEKTH